MEFWKEPLQREIFKSRAEKLTLYMCDLYDTTNPGDISCGVGLQSTDSSIAASLEPQRRGNDFHWKIN